MSVLAEILLAFAVILTVSAVTVVLLARMLYRRVRQNRALNSAVLRARSRVGVGPRHEILRLRVRLRDSLASGRAAVALAAQGAGPRGELQRAFSRLEQEGAAVEAQLLLLSTERDPVVLADALPGAAARVDLIVDLVRGVRSVVADALAARTDDSLALLSDDVHREIAAVYAGVWELHALTVNDRLAAAHRPAVHSTPAHPPTSRIRRSSSQSSLRTFDPGSTS